MSLSLCAKSVANTGVIQCDVAPGIPAFFMVWNGSAKIEDIQGSQFQAFLEANSKLSKNDINKIFVFPIIQDITDATEANKEGTLNQGFKTILLEGKPAYTYKVFAGQSTVPQLRKFNNQSVRTLTMDTNMRAWGVRSTDNYVGAQAKIFTGGLKFATGQNVEEGVATISISYLAASELNDDAAFGEVDSAAGIVGLLDANIFYISNVGNVFEIGVSVPTAEIGESISLYDTYSVELEAAALWSAKTGANFTVDLPIITVAKNDALSAWTITFDPTAYGLLGTNAKIELSLAPPPDLDAADIDGIEGVPVILTKTA